MPDSMRAAVFHETGDPDVVVVEERPRPTPGPGEVRLRVLASALNHLDLWVRRGLPIEITMPHIGGSDIVGVVEATGAGVSAALAGTRVVVDPSLDYGWYDGPGRGPAFDDPPLRIVGEHTDGGFADFVVVPAANLVQVPDEVESEVAAAAALASVTAWHGLFGRGRLRAGETVLITGASGGVSTMAVQFASRAGARVHALTSGAENVRRVRELGAHHVHDRTAGPDGAWARGVKEATGGRGVDLILDSVGAAVWSSLLRLVAVRGRIVSYGATTGHAAPVDLRHLFWKQFEILGSTMGPPADFRAAMAAVFRGEATPPIHTVLSLDDARRAHRLLEDGDVFGKVVLRP
jgi:NADPH:quinone reductase-like Zn-dependent oxidoreductase